MFDLETTGVDVSHDRIVTAHIGVIDARGDQIASRTWLADPGIPIPDGAAAIHGVTTAHARAHGRAAVEVVGQLLGALRSLLGQGLPIVAYNASYDFSLLAAEAVRHGHSPLVNPSPIIDPYILDKAFDRYRPGKRTLGVVAAHYDVDLAAAHEAAADALAAGRLAQAIARQFPLAASPADLHTRQVGWARAQAASLTEYLVRLGRIEPDDALDGTWPVRSGTVA